MLDLTLINLLCILFEAVLSIYIVRNKYAISSKLCRSLMLPAIVICIVTPWLFVQNKDFIFSSFFSIVILCVLVFGIHLTKRNDNKDTTTEEFTILEKLKKFFITALSNNSFSNSLEGRLLEWLHGDIYTVIIFTILLALAGINYLLTK